MLSGIKSVDPNATHFVEDEEEEVTFTTTVIKIPKNEDEASDTEEPNKVIVEATETVTNKQTTFDETSIFAKAKENYTQFVMAVDGSRHSEYAFDFVTEELLKMKNTKLMITHIFNSALDEKFNYQNKRESVLWDYSIRLIKYAAQASFVAEDRTSKIHALEQVNRLSTAKSANFLVAGYYGLKGQRGSNEELSKGIDYLLGNAKTPTMIIKEKMLRKEKRNGGYRWCFVMDKQYSNCIQCLRTFIKLVDPEKDFVYGYTLLPNYINYDINKQEFMDEINAQGIENYEYESEPYVKEPNTMVMQKINFETAGYDFVVFYNNPKKHKQDPETSENIQIVRYAMANVCFVNGEFGR